ncbi:beta-ketoacyl synthase [Ammoniphilus sp. CFH 90114]|uniref:beta-ketoacyl-[acyl-carrier-protein] synthase family protein n=1 Tax=Ammoniphilus sp. CFH 90114 TaxID=2493665 RepID=UPI00100DEE54|nr:beta-ketoacyl-[acyl-carrier-protein] synthase family protein [Ammoniphilus sp. CFH 90114]RXT13592.1 beta-ketoacyl-[acyl-carrier-protein] synthase family protein [Ammoniphilus sp. CFH 90114]
MQSPTKRIAITGLGVLSPIGSGQEKFWQQLCLGSVGTGPIQSFDTSLFDIRNGGEVTDVDPSTYFRVIDPANCARTTQLAVAATRMAVDDARLSFHDMDMERVAVCMGTTMGNQTIVESSNNHQMGNGAEVPSSLWSSYPTSYVCVAIAEELGIGGPSMTIPTACAAGNYAIGWGADLIRDGSVDIAIVGGTDALSRGCYAVFHRLGAISPDVCQPFDAKRKGTLVSEGAGVLVLEDYELAVKRGARIYAEFLGYGLSCDAHHPTAPHPEGAGAKLGMDRALAEADCDASQVSYISAHGTGTRANDSTESLAVRDTFGERSDDIPCSSIKSMLGHTMGAASAIEAVTCSLALYHQMVPPTANFQTPDPECLNHIVPNQPIQQELQVVLSNSFAFGGNNATILLGRRDQDE